LTNNRLKSIDSIALERTQKYKTPLVIELIHWRRFFFVEGGCDAKLLR